MVLKNLKMLLLLSSVTNPKTKRDAFKIENPHSNRPTPFTLSKTIGQKSDLYTIKTHTKV